MDLRSLGLARAVEAVTGRMVGLRTVGLPHRLDEFLAPTLLAVGLGLALVGLILAFRPVVDRRLTGAGPGDSLRHAARSRGARRRCRRRRST